MLCLQENDLAGHMPRVLPCKHILCHKCIIDCTKEVCRHGQRSTVCNVHGTTVPVLMQWRSLPCSQPLTSFVG